MSTLSVKILNPKARNILDDLASVGLIEVAPVKSAIAEFQEGMSGVAEQAGPTVCAVPDEYFGSLAFLWDSNEEIETFLKRRKEET